MSSSKFLSQLPQGLKEDVMNAAAEELKARFEWYKNALMDAVALPKLRGEEALTAYRTRTPEQWGVLEGAFPAEAQTQRKDWNKMEENSIRAMTRAVGDVISTSSLPFSPRVPAAAPAAPAFMPGGY